MAGETSLVLRHWPPAGDQGVLAGLKVSGPVPAQRTVSTTPLISTAFLPMAEGGITAPAARQTLVPGEGGPARTTAGVHDQAQASCGRRLWAPHLGAPYAGFHDAAPC